MSTAPQQPQNDDPITYALAYALSGIRVLPIKPGQKRPPMASWQHAATVDAKTIGNWWNGLYRDHGVGLAMGLQPDGRRLFALDVDEHDANASGSDTLAELEAIHGKLPDTVRSITGAGGAHLIFDSGDIDVTNGKAGQVGPGLDVRGTGGQIVVAPTVHPNGTGYLWEHGHAPWEAEIAAAPAWLLELVVVPVAEEVTRTTAAASTAERPGPPSLDSPADTLRATWDWPTELARRGWQQDPRHPENWTRPGKDPREGSSAVLHGTDGPFVVFTTDASTSTLWRAGKAGNGCVSLSPLAYLAAYDHQGDLSAATRALRDAQGPSVGLAGLVAPVTAQTAADGTDVAVDNTHGIARDGATFILDEQADLEARWGKGSEVLWARGESLVIAAPPGVGKTTLAGQVVAGLIGAQPDVLGYPVTPCRRVLYLAMDRPRQIRRSLRRRFGEQHRAILAEHLVVRPGPMASDLGKKPELLVELATLHDCDVIVVDSLKDAAVKLTDDETGGNVNRAIQHCNAADIDVLVLHHQRKGTNGDKPTKLEDVYGSSWIAAGAGSVILLWGEAGSEIVELTHLKQPADPVGPFTIEHDHHTGVSSISRGFDALAFLRLAGPRGASVSEAAQAEHGGVQASGTAKWKKTERRLRGLVRDGFARTDGRPQVGVPARYFVVDGLSDGLVSPVDNYPTDPVPNRDHHMDIAHGHAEVIHNRTDPMDPTWTPMDTEEETPGQRMDTPMDTLTPDMPWTSPGGFIPPGGMAAPAESTPSQPDERSRLL